MSDRQPDSTAMEYSFLAALACLAAIAALDARQFVFAGLCVIGSVVCTRRVGRAVALRLHLDRGPADRRGPLDLAP